MLEHGEELNLRMLQPLDTDTTVGVLRESGYLVPLNKWSKARQDYKGNTDRWVFKIVRRGFPASCGRGGIAVWSRLVPFGSGCIV